MLFLWSENLISLKGLTLEYLESLDFLKEKIKRDINISFNKDITALLGARRSGKTTLVLEKARELKNKGYNVLFLNFEEPELKNLKVRDLAKLIRKEYPEGEVYLFLDEVQEWINWDFNLRFLHDMKDFYLLVTGSSSSLLSSEIPSKLRGRYISYLIFPFSFREIVNNYLKYEESFRSKGKILSLFKDYLEFGGFPEVFIYKSREKLLTIMESIFYRDVIDRYKIKNTKIFKDFFFLIINNFASFYTYNSLKRSFERLNVSLDVKTIINYLEYLEKAFFLFELKKFDFSYKTQVKSERKYYLIDHAFSRFSTNPLKETKIIENIVFLQLKRKENKNPFQEIYYYKTTNNKEIDFLVKNIEEIDLLEVCYMFDEEHKKKLLKAMKELELKESFCITWDEEEEIKEQGKTIKLVPLWKWLLDY